MIAPYLLPGSSWISYFATTLLNFSLYQNKTGPVRMAASFASCLGCKRGNSVVMVRSNKELSGVQV